MKLLENTSPLSFYSICYLPLTFLQSTILLRESLAYGMFIPKKTFPLLLPTNYLLIQSSTNLFSPLFSRNFILPTSLAVPKKCHFQLVPFFLLQVLLHKTQNLIYIFYFTIHFNQLTLLYYSFHFTPNKSPSIFSCLYHHYSQIRGWYPQPWSPTCLIDPLARLLAPSVSDKINYLLHDTHPS